jgi:hypothetical protein
MPKKWIEIAPTHFHGLIRALADEDGLLPAIDVLIPYRRDIRAHPETWKIRKGTSEKTAMQQLWDHVRPQVKGGGSDHLNPGEITVEVTTPEIRKKKIKLTEKIKNRISVSGLKGILSDTIRIEHGQKRGSFRLRDARGRFVAFQARHFSKKGK